MFQLFIDTNLSTRSPFRKVKNNTHHFLLVCRNEKILENSFFIIPLFSFIIFHPLQFKLITFKLYLFFNLFNINGKLTNQSFTLTLKIKNPIFHAGFLLVIFRKVRNETKNFYNQTNVSISPIAAVPLHIFWSLTTHHFRLNRNLVISLMKQQR